MLLLYYKLLKGKDHIFFIVVGLYLISFGDLELLPVVFGQRYFGPMMLCSSGTCLVVPEVPCTARAKIQGLTHARMYSVI